MTSKECSLAGEKRWAASWLLRWRLHAEILPCLWDLQSRLIDPYYLSWLRTKTWHAAHLWQLLSYAWSTGDPPIHLPLHQGAWYFRGKLEEQMAVSSWLVVWTWGQVVLWMLGWSFERSCPEKAPCWQLLTWCIFMVAESVHLYIRILGVFCVSICHAHDVT